MIGSFDKAKKIQSKNELSQIQRKETLKVVVLCSGASMIDS